MKKHISMLLDELSTKLYPPPLDSFRKKKKVQKHRGKGPRRWKKLKRGGRKGDVNTERKGEKEKGRKSSEGFGSITGRILLITRVLWGNETKRFPFNCTLRPVHSTIVLSKNLITGAYGRYPRPATRRPCVRPGGTAITHEMDTT